MNRQFILTALIALLSVVLSRPAIAAAHSGWVDGVTATATGSTQYTAVDTTWTVPAMPITKSDGQILRIFNGEGTASGIELTPTLVWGVLPTQGGSIGSYSGWEIAAVELAVDGKTYAAAPIAVNPGDTIEGLVEFYGSNATERQFVDAIRDQTTGSGWSVLYVYTNFSETWTHAYGAVLSASTNSNNDFPGPLCAASIAFTPAQVWDQNMASITPAWSFGVEPTAPFHYNGPNCGFFAAPVLAVWELGF